MGGSAELPHLNLGLAPRAARYDDRGSVYPQTWNAYAYVGNQPLSQTDPQGLCPNYTRGCIGGVCIIVDACAPLPGGGGANPFPGDPSNDGGPGLPQYPGPDPPSCGRSGGFCPTPGTGELPPSSLVTRFTNWFSRERACTDRLADKVSIAGGLHALGIANGGGLGTTLLDAALGNPISGLFSGFDRRAAGATILLSGTYLGFGGKGLVQEGLAGTAIKAGAGGFWSSVTGAGETLTTLFSGEASLASTTITATEAATGAGLGIIAYDAGSWAVSGLARLGR